MSVNIDPFIFFFSMLKVHTLNALYWYNLLLLGTGREKNNFFFFFSILKLKPVFVGVFFWFLFGFPPSLVFLPLGCLLLFKNELLKKMRESIFLMEVHHN